MPKIGSLIFTLEQRFIRAAARQCGSLEGLTG
jgi:hypothetical protein